jgi:hypothetical protein
MTIKALDFNYKEKSTKHFKDTYCARCHFLQLRILVVLLNKTTLFSRKKLGLQGTGVLMLVLINTKIRQT